VSFFCTTAANTKQNIDNIKIPGKEVTRQNNIVSKIASVAELLSPSLFLLEIYCAMTVSMLYKSTMIVSQDLGCKMVAVCLFLPSVPGCGAVAVQHFLEKGNKVSRLSWPTTPPPKFQCSVEASTQERTWLQSKRLSFCGSYLVVE
jgi:hypothetical protein